MAYKNLLGPGCGSCGDCAGSVCNCCKLLGNLTAMQVTIGGICCEGIPTTAILPLSTTTDWCIYRDTIVNRVGTDIDPAETPCFTIFGGAYKAYIAKFVLDITISKKRCTDFVMQGDGILSFTDERWLALDFQIITHEVLGRFTYNACDLDKTHSLVIYSEGIEGGLFPCDLTITMSAP